MATPPNSLKSSSKKSSSEGNTSKKVTQKEIKMSADSATTPKTNAAKSANKTKSNGANSATHAQAVRSAVKPAAKASSQNSGKSIPSEAVAKRAFEIWQEEGCPNDRQEANWAQAERELRAKYAV